jgi:hypothetical protein
MNKLLNLAAILALFLSAQSSLAQNLKTDSIFSWGKTGWELPADMVSDTEGNFYLCGSFSGEMPIGNTLLKSNGKRDIFLVKFNGQNQLLWARNFGGPADDNAYSLLSIKNDIYLSGAFKETIGFGNEGLKLSGKGPGDLFLAKLSPDGSVIWVKSLLSSAPTGKAFLQPDKEGNVWISGTYTKPVELENFILGNDRLKGIYAACYSPEGTFAGHFYFDSEYDILLNDFATDLEGMLVFGGSFTESLEISNKSLISKGRTDGFLLKLNPKGEALWMENFGGLYEDAIKSLHVDAQGNIYAAGDFKFSMDLGKSFTARQNMDIFLLKYRSDGELTWARQFGTDGNSFNSLTSLELAGANKIFLSGNYRGTIQNSPEIKTPGNSKNAFLARFTMDGEKEWVMASTSPNENKLNIKYDINSGALFFNGFFSEGFKLGEYELRHQNYKDVVFGSLMDCELAPKVNLGPDTTLCYGTPIEARGNFVKYTWNTGHTESFVPVKQTGKYTIKVHDRFGCSSSDTVIIKVLPSPGLKLGPDTSICMGQHLVLNAPEDIPGLLWENGTSLKLRILSQTGNYWLKVTDSLGCSATDTLKLTVHPLPEFELGSDILVKPSNTIELVPALPPGKHVLQWSTGQTTEKIYIRGENIREDCKLGLSIVDSLGCRFSDELKLIPDKSNEFTGTPDDYRLFPNPTKGKFTVYIPVPENVKGIELYDTRGTLIQRIIDLGANPPEMDLGGMAKGTYLIRIIEEKSSRELKVVLE